MSLPRGWAGFGLAGVVLPAILLAGCGGEPASSAATVGEERIGLQTISDQLQAINGVLGNPPDDADVQMTNTIVRNNVVYDLVDQAAAAAQITVTQTQVEQRLAAQAEFVGSESLLDQQAAQVGVAPDMVETDVRISLLADELAAALAAGFGLSDEEAQQLLVGQIQQFSEEIGVSVNPRFGVWDVETLGIIADPDAPSQPAGEIGLTGLR